MLEGLHLKIAIVAVIAFAAALATGTAGADPDPLCDTPIGTSGVDQCVDAIAIFPAPGGTGEFPVVEHKFELPDMGPGILGVQYTSGSEGKGACLLPTEDDCINDAGNDLPDSQGKYGHLHHDGDPCKSGDPDCQMTTKPNIDDLVNGFAEKREIEIWAILSNANGLDRILAVTAHVTDAAGDKKNAVPIVLNDIVSCEDLGLETDNNMPLHAAVNTGQVPHEKISMEDCSGVANTKVYKGSFFLNNDQPYGKYEVCVSGLDHKGIGEELCNFFEVQNVLAYRLDFDEVLWPTIQSNETLDQIPGSIFLTGNSEACVAVNFHTLVGKTVDGPNQFFITSFGAQLKEETLTFDTNNVDQQDYQQFALPMPRKGENKLLFTVNTGIVIEGEYNGALDISIKKPPTAGDCVP